MVFNAAGDGYCRRYFVSLIPIRICPWSGVSSSRTLFSIPVGA